MMEEDYRLSAEEKDSLKNLDLNSVAGIVPAESVLGKEVGPVGSKAREEFDAKARAWYYGEVLRERRRELGMTQKELAESVGCERTYINRIEKGETDMQLSSFLRLADALGVNLRLEFSPAH